MSSFLCCTCVVFRHYSSVYHGAVAHMFFTCHRVMGGVHVLLSNKTTNFLGSTKTTGALEAQKQLLSGTGFCLLGWISAGKVAIADTQALVSSAYSPFIHLFSKQTPPLQSSLCER